MKKIFLSIIPASLISLILFHDVNANSISAQSAEQKISTCMGGFNGKRDLLLVIKDNHLITKSVQVGMTNNRKWSLLGSTETMYIFKRIGFNYFNDDYFTIAVSKSGSDAAISKAFYSQDFGYGFEMEEFKCSGF